MATTIDSVAVVAGNVVHHSAERLADHAVRDALAAALIEPADVDLLLNTGLFHDRMLGEPALAALIQEDVGANPEDPHGEGHGTFSFDVANGSAGVLERVADRRRVPARRHHPPRGHRCQRREPRTRHGPRLSL